MKGFPEGNLVTGFGRNIDAEDFSEQRLEILSALVGIVASTAVTVADVEHAVRSEVEPASVVVLEFRRIFQDHLAGRRVGGLLVLGGEADDARLLFLIRVVDIEAAGI